MLNREPIAMALRVAEEYGTPNSYIDSGNLYEALRQCLDRIFVLECLASDEEAEKLRQKNDELMNVLLEIHSVSHDHSTGPEVPDGYWQIRNMAAAVV
jgi:hypothetical protein